NCASSRPSPRVAPTMTTLRSAIRAFSPFERGSAGPPRRRADPPWEGSDGRDRLRAPVGQKATLRQDVVSRLLELLHDRLHVDADELAAPLHGVAGDEDGIDVRRVGEGDD